MWLLKAGAGQARGTAPQSRPRLPCRFGCAHDPQQSCDRRRGFDQTLGDLRLSLNLLATQLKFEFQQLQKLIRDGLFSSAAILVDRAGGSVQQLAYVLDGDAVRSEEHTSELQSRGHLVC